MKIEEITRPERVEIFTSAQLTIPSKDFEENPEVMEMSVLIEIARIEDEDNVNPYKILYEVRNELNALNQNVVDNLINQYEFLSCRISKLSRLSETINKQLESIYNFYLKKNEIAEIVERNSKCKELKKYPLNGNLTFNQLRNILSCIVKTDKVFHQINELNNSEKRKNFTKKLHNYIYDRDCYTHGFLFFLFPNFTPILEVKPPNEKSHYIIISEKVIIDNMKLHKELRKILEKISLISQGFEIKQ
ncbi:hypothetical protein [Tenacibaculum maritimum]|uniref:hypothetical protein n=3 Tax=Tenacibaculum maritimum TaxID=107401 RepID=UPI0038768612